MTDTQTRQAPLNENQHLRERLEELEETLRAIRSGEVDALVVSRPEGEQVYTLKGALEPYRVMVEVMSEGAVTLAQDGTILYCNSRFAQLVKTPHEQIAGLPLHRWVAAPDQDKFNKMLAQGWSNPVRDGLAMQAGDASPMPVHFSMSPLPESAGKGIAVVITDLTEVVAAAEARMSQRESEEQFKYMFDHSPIGKSITSPSGVIKVNHAFCEMLGYTEEELQNRRWQDITYPDDYRATQQEVDALLAGKQQSARFVQRFLHKNGSVVWADVSTSLRRDEAGKPLYFMTHIMDITERKRAEESLSIAYARFSTIFNQAPLGIALIDSFTGRIHEVNPRFAEIAGRTIEEMMHIDWMSITHPDDVQEDLDNMALLNSGKIPGFNMDKRYIRPDGSVVWINMTIAPLRGEQNISPRHLCMIDDITERKRGEEEIRRLNADLERRVAERTADLESFAYSVSHDLRVPLRAIDGFSRIVLKQYECKLDDEGKRLLNVVCDNTKKLGQLIDDILAFSRMGRLGMSMSEINMEELAHAVFEDLKPGLAGRELAMEIKPLPHCHGDPAMLRQVWINLLGNAIKFTRHKEAALVEVGGHIEGAEIIYYVKDNGAGFDMQYAEKLFGVFQRLHGIEEFEGTGIGLAIVKRIIIRHGGRVWAEGKVNSGAAFYFALPIKEIT